MLLLAERVFESAYVTQNTLVSVLQYLSEERVSRDLWALGLTYNLSKSIPLVSQMQHDLQYGSAQHIRCIAQAGTCQARLREVLHFRLLMRHVCNMVHLAGHKPRGVMCV